MYYFLPVNVFFLSQAQCEMV